MGISVVSWFVVLLLLVWSTPGSINLGKLVRRTPRRRQEITLPPKTVTGEVQSFGVRYLGVLCNNLAFFFGPVARLGVCGMVLRVQW